jgi:transposase InsO family protein
MSNIRVDVDKFDGSGDYRIWRKKIRALLAHNKLLRVLSEPIEWPENTSKSTQEELLETATGLIIFNLSDAIIRLVDKEDIKLANSGENEALSDENQAIIILNSLPESYKEVKNAIKYGRTEITLEEVISPLKSKDLEIKNEKHGGSNGEVNFSRGRPNQRKHGHYKSKSHSRDHHKGKSHNKGRSNSKEPTDPTGCYNCGKPGHFKRDCYFLNKGKPNKYKGQGENSNSKPNFHKNNQANYGDGYESVDSGEVYIVASSFKDEWILDSGCTFHMTNDKSYMFDYRESKGGKVILGNNQTCEIKGSGSIRFKMYDGIVRTLTAVRYVPNLSRNLISISVLDDLGVVSKVEAGHMKLSRGALTIMKGIKNGGLYYLQGSPISSCNITTHNDKEEEIATLWHRRLGHISERGLQLMSEQQLLGKDKVSKLDFCEHCILGKHHRLKFTAGTHNSKRILEYVHSDLWGPEKISTHGGCSYFLSIVDDYSRKVWIYLLKNKNDAFTKFKHWKLLVENLTNEKLKTLRTDNGLEFCNNEFDLYCKENGLQRHRTVRITPQQNGVAERMNRTILNKVRCMLLQSGLSQGFWGEAALTAVHLINRSPSRAIEGKTPEEKWSGKPPNLSHLKVFGCAAYAHQSIGKLEPRALKCVFLGYPEGVKGYRLWVKEKGGFKTMNSRDVIFQENIFPCLHNEKSSAGIEDTNPAGTNLEVKTGSNQVEQNEDTPGMVQVEPNQS